MLREYLALRLPRWDALATLGRSRLLALTMITPFIGWLILFNQHLVDLLTLSPTLLTRWTGQTETTEMARGFTLGRLEITYFGLSALGVAAFVFNLACPGSIRKHDSVADFVEAQGSMMTRTRRLLTFRDLARVYLARFEDGEIRKHTLLGLAGYPRGLAAHMEGTILRVAREAFSHEMSVLGSDPPGSQRRRSVSEQFVGRTAISDETGTLSMRGVAGFLSGTTPEQGILEMFDAKGEGTERDLIMLQYATLNYAKPAWRAFIAVSYAVGFGLLIIPTLGTFWRVLRYAFGF